MRYRLRGLNVERLKHPDDSAVINKLNKIPYFTEFLNKTVGTVREAYSTIEAQGDGWAITKNSSPKFYAQLEEVCRILNVKDVPYYSTEWSYYISGYSVGMENYRIVMLSGALDLLNDEEMLFMLGHELGHFLCGHKPYHMLLETLYMPLVDDTSVKMWATLIKLPLLEWYRISDYTADRVGLLCCQDLNVALSTMIKQAGLPRKYYEKINIEGFIQQIREFNEKYTSTMDKMVKILSIRAAASPWLVVRTAKLIEWYESGEYHKIINNK